MPILPSFADLGLATPILKAVADSGYETPSPIQAESIPPLLAGHDVIGMAQTGTGKTAAFALPLLSRLDPTLRTPQILVLTPTRELAIQVAEAMQSYARHLPNFHVLPIYGGQAMQIQLRQLRRGAQVIVGTPGRIQDHLRRKSLELNQLRAVVLDEADEMLRMGFIDDVEQILEHTPADRQIALFSATIPAPIRKIAGKHLHKPVEIRIRTKTATVKATRQRYWLVEGTHKLDALTRILEVEETDALIIFVRTKNATTELAEKLGARGFEATALNGDINQAQREKTIERLKRGELDIVIATDVAARGLDVARVSHVINYDIPYDPESYVHRIGRTGRAGRTGDAILFVAHREKRMLRTIERATGQTIEPMRLPNRADITDRRTTRFKAQIQETLGTQNLDFFRTLAVDAAAENGVDSNDIAAALAYLLQREQPLVPELAEIEVKPQAKVREKHKRNADDGDIVRYRLEVGKSHGVEPRHIVGAIANEAGIESQYIGAIRIHDRYTTVDLPASMPNEVFQHLQKVWVCGQQLGLSKPERGQTVPGSSKIRPQRTLSKHRQSAQQGNDGSRKSRR